MNLQERYLTIRDYIDSENTGKVIDKIIEFNNYDIQNKITNKKPIHLHIQSQGGNTLDGFASVDIMLSSNTPIFTYADGYVESTALDIFLAGSERLANNHTMFLIHGTTQSVENMSLSNFKSHLKMLLELEDWGKQLLVNRSNLSMKQINELYNLNTDIFFNSKQALEYGIITHILMK